MRGDDSASQAARDDHRVTPLELFFDLVFVFAITQVTGFIAAHPTWTRLAEALAILAVLWWAWVAYAWLGNTAGSDDGALRVVLLGGDGAAARRCHWRFPARSSSTGCSSVSPTSCVRILHLAGYAVVARGDPALRGVVARVATTSIPAVVAASSSRGCSTAGRAARAGSPPLAVDYGGLALRGTAGLARRAGALRRAPRADRHRRARRVDRVPRHRGERARRSTRA